MGGIPPVPTFDFIHKFKEIGTETGTVFDPDALGNLNIISLIVSVL